MEVNRLAREERAEDGGPKYVLDGVVVVIDVENWKGYADTSYTARMQAQFTDLMVLNKWEAAGERKLDECLDRIGDLESQVAVVRSDMGKVNWQVLLGLDSALAKSLGGLQRKHEEDAEHGSKEQAHAHDHARDHQSEVEVLSVTLTSRAKSAALDTASLQTLLTTAPRDEVYRIKAFLHTNHTPASSEGAPISTEATAGQRRKYILNWAFERWTFTEIPASMSTSGTADAQNTGDPILGMTIVLARGEADKWAKKLQAGAFFKLDRSVEIDGAEDGHELHVSRTL